MSAAGRGAIWGLGKGPVSESQHRPLGFWRAKPCRHPRITTTLPSSMEIRLMAWVQALVQTESLTTCHQVTARPELPVVTRMAPGSPSMNTCCVRETSQCAWAGEGLNKVRERHPTEHYRTRRKELTRDWHKNRDLSGRDLSEREARFKGYVLCASI